MKIFLRSHRIRTLLLGAAMCFSGFTGRGQANLEGDQLRIGYWNLSHLSGRRENPAYKQMARVLHDMDCVALGQAYNDRALAVLVNELTILGGRWNKVKNRRGVGEARSHNERYAILYRSDKMGVQGRPRTVTEPMIHGAFGKQRPFDHQPFVCRFATVDGRMDFSLMVVNVTGHLARPLKNGRPALEKPAFRLGEVRAMKELFLTEQQGPETDGDLILMGNFRYETSHPVFAELLSIPGLVNAMEGSAPTDFTTGQVTDLIFFKADTLPEYTGHAGVIRFDQTLFEGHPRKAQAVCSDHRPVWITVKVPAQDTD